MARGFPSDKGYTTRSSINTQGDQDQEQKIYTKGYTTRSSINTQGVQDQNQKTSITCTEHDYHVINTCCMVNYQGDQDQEQLT